MHILLQAVLTAQSVDSFRFEILMENINSNEHTVIQMILLNLSYQTFP